MAHDATDATAADHVMPTEAGPDAPADTSMTACGSGIGDCNPVTNATCPSMQGCFVAGTADGGTTTQCAMAGTVGFGQRCTALNDCAPGFSCLNDHCTKLCCGPGDDDRCSAAAAGATCNLPVNLGGGVQLYACAVASNCNWFAQDCADGGNCLPISMDGTAMCQPTGTAAPNAACGGSAGACERGYFCASTSGSGGSCLQICDPRLGPGDDAGVTPDGGVSRLCPSGFSCFRVTGLPNDFGVCGTH